MSRFTIQISPQKKEKQRRLLYIMVLSGIAFLILLIAGGMKSFAPFIVVLFAVQMFSIVFSAMNQMGKIKYAEINEQIIHWDTYDNKQLSVLLEWKDIHWVKKEQDGSLSFFLDSSFIHNLKLVDFSEEDQLTIIELVSQCARQHHIRLVNFSEAVLATA